MYNPSALNFGGYGWSSHCFELSWLGYAHFMRGSSTAAWTQTMTIESTGRWKYLLGLNVVGTCVATVYSTSDSRIKYDVENIPQDECINLLITVSAKTYTRKDMPGKRRAGFIAQDFFNVPLSLGVL